MRNSFLLALGLVTVLSVLPFLPAPVGPGEAFAVDDPALPDGGALVVVTDGGTLITVDLTTSYQWNMAITVDPGGYYRMCEANIARCCAFGTDGGFTGDDGGWLYDGGQNLGQGTCSATTANQPLAASRTFDIPVPSNRRYLSVLFGSSTSSDGGQPTANVQKVTQ